MNKSTAARPETGADADKMQRSSSSILSAAPGEGRSYALFDTLEQWFAQVPSEYGNASTQKAFAENVCMNLVHKEMQVLRVKLICMRSPLVFCHNDLLGGNIVYDSTKRKRI